LVGIVAYDLRSTFSLLTTVPLQTSMTVGVFFPDLRSTETRLTSVHSRSVRNGRRPAVRPRRRRAEEKSGEALADLADCYRGILVGVGEDPTRHGLRQTPERAARAMLYFTKGYDEKIEGKLAGRSVTINPPNGHIILQGSAKNWAIGHCL